jgi:hypothetical protein
MTPAVGEQTEVNLEELALLHRALSDPVDNPAPKSDHAVWTP